MHLCGRVAVVSLARVGCCAVRRECRDPNSPCRSRPLLSCACRLVPEELLLGWDDVDWCAGMQLLGLESLEADLDYTRVFAE